MLNKALLMCVKQGPKTFTCQYDTSKWWPSGWDMIIRINGSSVYLTAEEAVVEVSVGDTLELYAHRAGPHADKADDVYVVSKKGILVGAVTGSSLNGYILPITIESVPASLIFYVT